MLLRFVSTKMVRQEEKERVHFIFSFLFIKLNKIFWLVVSNYEVLCSFAPKNFSKLKEIGSWWEIYY